jgi:hypothetical protein
MRKFQITGVKLRLQNLQHGRRLLNEHTTKQSSKRLSVTLQLSKLKPNGCMSLSSWYGNELMNLIFASYCCSNCRYPRLE